MPDYDEKVLVSALPLRELLVALNSKGPELRELMALRGPLVGEDNPINILQEEFNSAVEGDHIYLSNSVPSLLKWSIVESAGDVIIQAPQSTPGSIKLNGSESSLAERLLFSLAKEIIQERANAQ